MKSGDRVRDHLLREKLGEGGFGEVWKAENPLHLCVRVRTHSCGRSASSIG